MKKTLTILSLAILVIGLLAVIGCGSSSSSSSTETVETEDVEVIDLNEDVSKGIIGTFNDNSGAAASITFASGGKFNGNAWGSEKSGTYKLQKSADDYNQVVLTFDDGSPSETWSIGISMGKVAAVTSPEGNQYDKATK